MTDFDSSDLLADIAEDAIGTSPGCFVLLLIVVVAGLLIAWGAGWLDEKPASQPLVETPVVCTPDVFVQDGTKFNYMYCK